jgi:hypothetical protein
MLEIAANQSARVMTVSSVVEWIGHPLILLPCGLLTIIHVIELGMGIVGVIDDQGTT